MTKRKQTFSAIGIFAILGALALFTLPFNVFSTTTTPALYGTNVPTADSTANDVSADVIGSKTDAAAAGAVSATESIMAYAKQIVGEQIVNDTNIDAILVDTETTIPATIATAQNDLDILTGATGANLLTATQASIDAIEVDTETTIPATITTAQNDLDILTGATGANLLTATQASIDAIEVDTETTLPATLAIISAAAAPSYTHPNYFAITADMTSATWNTVAAHEIAVVTGAVRMQIMIETVATIVTVSTSGTLALGVAGNTAAVIAATALDAAITGDVWSGVYGAVATTEIGVADAHSSLTSAIFDLVVVNGIDVGYTIAAQAGTTGSLKFHIYWTALDSTGAVTAGAGGIF